MVIIPDFGRTGGVFHTLFHSGYHVPDECCFLIEGEKMVKDCYWSKLLLFGEYSMIFDSNALVIPMKQFSARWERSSDESLRFSREELQKYVRFLSEDPLLSEQLDTASFANDIKEGWALASDIPIGYGLGSSGTVVAAVYDRYAQRAIEDLMELKRLFAKMEGYFHGSSSGIDPLQCYLGKPFQISADGVVILPEDFLNNNIRIGLLDTKTTSNTRPLVEGFRRQREDPAFLRAFEENYLPCVNQCMDTLMRGDSQFFFDALKKLSHAQYLFLRNMIPDCVLPLFGKTSEFNFSIKILGSGGGGYMLVFTDDVSRVNEELREFEILWVQ